MIDAISAEMSSRFSQSAMKKIELIETILLGDINDRLRNLSTTQAMERVPPARGLVITVAAFK